MSLKEKYPKAKYDPDPTCRFCKGTGERTVNLSSGPTTTGCICIFVGDISEQDRADIAISIGQAAKKAREELLGKGTL